MPNTREVISNALNYAHRKNKNRNYVSATFHMITISLISMSLVDLDWFIIEGGDCIPFLPLSDFFHFGYKLEDIQNPGKFLMFFFEFLKERYTFICYMSNL